MQQHIMWSPWTEPGLEHLQLTTHAEDIIADSFILGVKDQVPFRLRYEIHCDQHWKLRTVLITLLSGPDHSLHLLTDGQGNWTTVSGEPLPLLSGCLDVDISATPFTNTLPIRRLALPRGSSATLRIAYIRVPDLQLSVAEQRYRCLETTSSGGRYRFESLEQGATRFTADLPVDQDGLVLDYPGLFRRVETR